jgi:hypothetical protein
MIIRNKKHLCGDKKLREAAGEMQPLLFFKEQTLLPLQLIFSQIPILFLSITVSILFSAMTILSAVFQPIK